ncbi:hypothetical protein KOI40_18195 [Aestuariicella sp. G3-2]|uniref:hypothetical protein n=1 Tax=Pseudomaricurvus albidus TaxID=2842452 RepID=UPI001C0DCE26|nr:hypothetical protein [Aestuariicella albida]MBU3071762.1 hypothetical protein [Aestuariicella albida]
MSVVKKELIKEFEYEIDGLEHPVKGYVYLTNEIDHLPYRWEISHYCRPHKDAATVYRPSRRHAETAEEAEYLLNMYASNFTNIDVVPA